MEDNNKIVDEITQKEEGGKVNISDDVVATIAGIATSELEGVYGMSGGVAYVLDEQKDLYMRLSKEHIQVSEVTEYEDAVIIKELLTEHYQETHSEKAKQILNDFEKFLPCFKKLIPEEFAMMQKEMKLLMAGGETPEQAEIDAFYRVQKGVQV